MVLLTVLLAEVSIMMLHEASRFEIFTGKAIIVFQAFPYIEISY